MIKVHLKDGNIKSFDKSVTILEVAKEISSSLAKKAVAGSIDNKLYDLSHLITKDIQLNIITESDKESLDIIRHSCAHLLAHAVKELFPNAQVIIGPVIADGFYYDFKLDNPFTIDDLEQIEKRMHLLANKNINIIRKEISKNDAIKYFNSIGEHYKVKIIEEIPDDQVISLYEQDNFTDLCRGPHVINTNKIKFFKLMKLSGSYWRGNSNNEALQRIYGTAFLSKEDLAQYLLFLEEAQKRDHRKLGQQLDLFHTQDEAPGMVFWHPNGYIIWNIVESYIREELKLQDYKEIKTPLMMDRSLWEASGHWEMYRELMFTTNSENRHYAIKPMSCPGHIQIFNQGIKSYRDLPIRFSEFGSCHRNEPSGSLHGLMRVRGFVQDDAHIFCRIDQIEDEAKKVIELVFKVYKKFGFDNILIKLSTRPSKRVGDDSLWDIAEDALAKSLKSSNLEYSILEGEGAFYGPKIEFTLKDCLNREWQCGTLQLDFNLPVRLNAKYFSADNKPETPVMLHRAILGSLERFIGILIEHYAGHLPLWLSPIQMVIINVSEHQIEYAKNIYKNLQECNFRCKIDISNEKIGYKIREYTLLKIPYMIIIGDKEVNSKMITIRAKDGSDLGAMNVSDFKELVQKQLN